MRSYRPSDRGAVRRIYADTAFFGEPVEAYFDDRELFADLGVSVYLDHFPEHVFVAEAAQGPVGYVLGSPQGDVEVRQRLAPRLPAVAARLLRRHYRLGRKTLLYFADNAWAGLRGQLLEIRDPAYPANLHINVDPAHRAKGLGSALLEAYLAHLRDLRIPGVHAVTTDQNAGAVKLFRRAGFQLIQERRTSVWRRHLGRDVTLLGFGLRLN